MLTHRKTLALAALSILSLSALAVSACLGGGSSSDCGTYSQGLQTALVDEGKLSQSVAEEGPYPMALIVSQAALNELFAAVAGADLPDIVLRENPFDVPVTVTLSPQLPLIQIGGELGCVTCILTQMGFGLSIDVDGSAVSGSGLGRYQFPLSLDPNGLDSTRVMAQLGQSSVLQVDLQISGVDDSIMNFLEPLISQATTAYIQDQFGDTELFELGAWTFGDGDVKLLGRGPIIEPDFGTIVIGVHTNLVRPLSGAVAIDPVLPEGADIGLQIHPELVQTMIQRMLHEGHIERSYGLSGQPDPGGDHQVSLNFMRSAPDSQGLQSNFRLWRTGGGLCGYADLQADLAASISDQRLALSVSNIDVTGAAGSGEFLLSAGDWLSSGFTDDLINFSQLTINYDSLSLPNNKVADMSAESFRLDLNGQGLSLFLNIDAIADAP